jgi:biopolymer transport protein ExbD
MGKIKVAKHAPSIDMTPMVDLAFLLVTFFMLTASFRMAEPVIVDPPSSHSDKVLPENTVLVSVGDDGKVFFGIGNGEAKIAALADISKKYGVKFTDEQIKKFGGLSGFGVEVKDLPAYLDASENERIKISKEKKGIPMDSLNNQLKDWITYGATELNVIYTRNRNAAIEKNIDFIGEKPRYAIKADAEAKYIFIKDVFKTFTDMEIYTFNLITSLEGGETKAAAPAAH